MSQPSTRYALGIDLGGTKIELGIVNEKGHVIAHQRLETHNKEGARAIQDQILESIKFLRQQSHVSLSGIGIGIAGQIDPLTGTILFSPNLRWSHVPLRKNLEEALKIPVIVLNDVKAITWGEWTFGAGKECDDLLCVFVGTGIGAGIVSQGKLLEGHSHTFGEVGHMTIEMNGPLCTCGRKGCFESLAGGWGITARAKEALQAIKNQTQNQMILSLAGGNLDAITTKMIVEAFHADDPLAVSLIKNVEKALIVGFSNLINLYNPGRLIIGGGIIDGMPHLLPLIIEGIKKEALQAATQNLEIHKAHLEKNAGVIGSAAVIFHSLLNRDKEK